MYCGYITELKDLRKHSNADKLQLCTVFGNTVIVDLSYYEGQKVVFFPVDGQLGKEYAEENNLLRIKNCPGNCADAAKFLILKEKRSDRINVSI